VSTLLLSAAEPSGDLLCAGAARALLTRDPDLALAGVAGPATRSVSSFQPIADVAELSGAGLVELIPRLPSILRVRATLRRAIRQGRPDAVVLVDAPDLHLPLLRMARREGIPAIQLVAPQFWAWRARRGRTLARDADRVLCLFRFEVDLLRRLGADAVWVGHPVVERAAGARRVPDPGPTRRIVLLPGSRPHERARHGAVFVDAGQRAARGRDVEVVLSWPANLPAPPGVTTSAAPGIELLASADVALVAPGTATLEAAMVACPLVVAGGLSPLSAFVARRLLRLPHVSLPNLLLGTEAVPEVLQTLDPARLADLLGERLDDGGARAAAEELRDKVAPVLGPPGYAERAAEAILELVARR
jgi:lipid-A-disaccharide synthase